MLNSIKQMLDMFEKIIFNTVIGKAMNIWNRPWSEILI